MNILDLFSTADNKRYHQDGALWDIVSGFDERGLYIGKVEIVKEKRQFWHTSKMLNR